MMLCKILVLLLLGSVFQANGAAIGSSPSPFEFVITQSTSPTPEAFKPGHSNDVLIYLQAMNSKLDRMEEAIGLLTMNTKAKKCDNTDEVLNEKKISQTSQEIEQFNLENGLIKNREPSCDPKNCLNSKAPDPDPDDLEPDLEQITDPPMNNTIPRDCCAIQKMGQTENGIYTVYPNQQYKTRAVQVFCDMTTNGGGWTVIQRREEVNGPTESFERNWDAYEHGFGDKTLTFWLGLRDITALTENNDQALRFDMCDWESKEKYAEYDTFHVAGPDDLYRMTVSGYTGNAGDSFSVNSNNSFSTLNRDNDIYSGSCARLDKGGWWYRACHWANPNGPYVVDGILDSNAKGVTWYGFRGLSYSLKRIDMKVRSRRYPNGCAV